MKQPKTMPCGNNECSIRRVKGKLIFGLFQKDKLIKPCKKCRKAYEN